MERQGQQPRPSSRAAERLTDGVGRELGTLRRSLTDALAEAERLEQAGRTDLAVDVLEEQRLVLARVHDQLMGHVSAAAVEREAESIVAAVEPTTLDLTALAAPSQTPARVAAAPDADELDELDDHGDLVGAGEPDRRSLAGRVLVSALAAVLGLVLLATPEPEAGRLTIASRPAADTGDASSAQTEAETEPEPGTDPHASKSHATDAASTAAAATTAVTEEVRAVHGPLPTLSTPAVAASTTAAATGAEAPVAPSGGSQHEGDEDTDEDLEVPTNQGAIEDRLDAVVPDPDTR